MKKLPLILLALFSFLPWHSLADTIILAADEWCPYNCEPDSDKPGFMVDIAKAVFEKKGHKVVYKVMSWDKAIEMAEKGYVNGIIGALIKEAPDFYFPEEEQGISGSYFYTNLTTNWDYKGINSLEGKAIGAIEDYSYSSEIDQYIEKNRDNPKKVVITSGKEPLKELVDKVILGGIDAIVEDRYVMGYYLKEIGKVGSLRVAGSSDSSNASLNRIFIAFSPKKAKSAEYAKMLSDGMTEIRKSGELQKILDKYGIEDWEEVGNTRY